MKILMITPYLPYPLLSGGQIRTYNLLKNLKDRHQITLFSFIRSHEERQYLPQLRKYCGAIQVFNRGQAWTFSHIFQSATTTYPFLVTLYLSKTFQEALKRTLEENRYDLIHAETFYVMPNLPPTHIPTLLVEQTIEYLVYLNFVQESKWLPLKPFLYLDVLKIKAWEKHYWQKASRLAAMSSADRQIMAKEVKNKQIDIVANGVDIAFFNQTQKKLPLQPTVLFVGQFKWLPNIDAANFLVHQIWPKIKSQVPQAKLWIVGRNPTREIRSLAGPDIKIDGDIEDIRTALGQAHVMLAPIRNGRGTKYKVLEAMATNLPVVTTPLGIEGIKARHQQEVLIARSAKKLAEDVVTILKNPQQGARIARQAKVLITQEYNWPLISQHLDNIYQQLGTK